MKKTLMLLFAATLLMFTAAAQNVSEISGVLNVKKPSEVKLYKVTHGRMEQIASSTPSDNGQFGFLFKPGYKGFYMVGTGDGLSTTKLYRFYVEGGDQLSIEINDSTYVLTGENTPENQLLTEWYDFTYPLEQKSVYFMGKRSTFKDFFPLMEKKTAASKTWFDGKATGNASFDRLMQETMPYDLAYYAMTLLYTPRSAHPTEADYTSYFSNFDVNRYRSDDFLLKQPYGTRLLSNLSYFSWRNKMKEYNFEKAIAQIPNDTLKGEAALGRMEGLKSYGDYLDMKTKFGQYFLTDDQKQRAQAIEFALATFKTGEKAIGFTYPDINGKEISLSDFKGKLVLVDVWATWCGPCKQQEPYWVTLEKEFEGKDVVFLGVSVDEDKEKWENYIREKQPKGVQVFAKGWSKIAKAYKINGIPRYMLFDRQGNIINVDAPRPSEPELKALLNEWLGK